MHASAVRGKGQIVGRESVLHCMNSRAQSIIKKVKCSSIAITPAFSIRRLFFTLRKHLSPRLMLTAQEEQFSRVE
jgi:hypothetical protein